MAVACTMLAALALPTMAAATKPHLLYILADDL